MATRSSMIGISPFWSLRTTPKGVLLRVWTSAPIARACRIIPLWVQSRTHAPAELGGVGQGDPAGPFDPAGQEAVQQSEGRSQKPGQPHAPVAEPMDRHRPKALLEQAALMGPQVLGPERPKADAGGILVAI